MNRILLAATASAAFLAPTLVQAQQINITATIKSYYGNNAYLAIYLVDPKGNFVQTLWVGGTRARYYRHLTDWARVAAGAKLDGITGASVGSGQTLKVTANVADAMLNAGYTMHVDTAVESGDQYGSEIVDPLDKASNGKAMSGAGYISSFKISF